MFNITSGRTPDRFGKAFWRVNERGLHERVKNITNNLSISDQDILTVARNRIRLVEFSREKQNSFLGRLSLRLLGEDLNKIETTKQEIKRLVELSGSIKKIPYPEDNQLFFVEYDIYKELLIKALKKIEKVSK